MRSLFFFTTYVIVFMLIGLSFPEAKILSIPEKGEYELRALIKPEFTALQKDYELNPRVDKRYGSRIRVLSNNKKKVYSIKLRADEKIDISWSLPPGKQENINLNSFPAYSMENNFSINNILSGNFFYLDTNNDSTIDRLFFIGDFFIIYDLKKIDRDEVISLSDLSASQKEIKKKILHKLGVYKYSEWQFDTYYFKLFDIIKNGEISGKFDHDGWFILQKNFSRINLKETPGSTGFSVGKEPILIVAGPQKN